MGKGGGPAGSSMLVGWFCSGTDDMTLAAIAQAGQALQKVRLVATDMDGTLTIAHKFSTCLLEALEALAAAGIPVVIVTGRLAGWGEWGG